ncbi:MAG: hypothetical protein H6Q71_1714 [Firmicutes bacterium]|nr:hypothetical protein [Bacillota bacterium]
MAIIKTIDQLKQEYGRLTKTTRQDLHWWIREFIQPAKKINHRQTSYQLKHLFEEITKSYVAHDQFKAGMLRAGYKPVEWAEENWSFKIRLVNSSLHGKQFHAWYNYSLDMSNVASELAREIRTDVLLYKTAAEKNAILDYFSERGVTEETVDTFYQRWDRQDKEKGRKLHEHAAG